MSEINEQFYTEILEQQVVALQAEEIARLKKRVAELTAETRRWADRVGELGRQLREAVEERDRLRKGLEYIRDCSADRSWAAEVARGLLTGDYTPPKEPPRY